jgi:hypothetical protein
MRRPGPSRTAGAAGWLRTAAALNIARLSSFNTVIRRRQTKIGAQKALNQARQAAPPSHGRRRHSGRGKVTRPKYTPSPGLIKERLSEIYGFCSKSLRGSELIQLDQGRAFGWDQPW